MKYVSVILISTFIFCGCGGPYRNAAKNQCPWDMQQLSRIPKFEWANRQGDVWSLIFEAEPYRGKPTRVFAYYASPATLKGQFNAGDRFPGIVLIHGGGGQAFKEWAKMWAQRGYAAISIDNRGQRDGFMYLDGGYPEHTNKFTFGLIDHPVTDQWPYHAVSNSILAHSLIRNFDEVDAHNTAVTGISWGGYTTCIVAGVDNRFKAAVPVYGCGFLDEDSSWVGSLDMLTESQKQKWIRLWDPSQYIGDAQMPVFFVNGTNDLHYRLNVYGRTYDLVSDPKNIRIEVNMGHSHPHGWAPKEIGLFIDSYLKGAPHLPKIETPQIEKGTICAKVQAELPLQNAKLNFTPDLKKANHKRQWQTVDAELKDGQITCQMPENATIWFLTVEDTRGAMVSSEVVFEKN